MPSEQEIKQQPEKGTTNAKIKCKHCLTHIWVCSEKDRITVRAGVKWCGREGHWGGDVVEPNLVAQESLPLFKLCSSEDAEVVKWKGSNKWVLNKLLRNRKCVNTQHQILMFCYACGRRVRKMICDRKVLCWFAPLGKYHLILDFDNLSNKT